MESTLEKLSGIIIPILSPVDENENIIEHEMRLLVDECIKNEFNGILVAGTSGEALALSQQQRNKSIEIAISQSKNKLPVICGVMDTSSKRVIENIKQAEDVGGTIFAATPVFYTNAPAQNEIIRHFEIISKHTKGNIIIYNQPQFTNIRITVESVCQLSLIDNIVGIKNSSPDLGQFQELLFFAKKSRFSVFQGNTDFAGVSILLGADGFVPIYGLIFPKTYKKLYKAGLQGNIREVMQLQKKLNTMSKQLKQYTHNIKSSKIGHNILYSVSKTLCEPQESINDREFSSVGEIIANFRNNLNE